MKVNLYVLDIFEYLIRKDTADSFYQIAKEKKGRGKRGDYAKVGKSLIEDGSLILVDGKIRLNIPDNPQLKEYLRNMIDTDPKFLKNITNLLFQDTKQTTKSITIERKLNKIKDKIKPYFLE